MTQCGRIEDLRYLNAVFEFSIPRRPARFSSTARRRSRSPNAGARSHMPTNSPQCYFWIRKKREYVNLTGTESHSGTSQTSKNSFYLVRGTRRHVEQNLRMVHSSFLYVAQGLTACNDNLGSSRPVLTSLPRSSRSARPDLWHACGSRKRWRRSRRWRRSKKRR